MDEQGQMMDKALLSLPFDLYERYELTRRLIAQLFRGREEPLWILDVGGNSGPLKQFLPRAQVVVTDVDAPTSLTSLPLRHDGYVRASGTHLPFPDDSFDAVTAHDTLEHVPEENRAAFLSELARVSRRFVIVNGPFAGPETEWAEHRLSVFLERVIGKDSGYLEEHRRFGLPDPDGIEEVIGSMGPFVSLDNGNLWLWLVLNAVKNYLRVAAADQSLELMVDEMANRVLAMRDVRGVAYRRAYVVAMDPSDRERVEAALRDLRWEPATSDPAGLAQALSSMEDQVQLIRDGGSRYGDAVSLEPVVRALTVTAIMAVAPHIEAQANLEALIATLEREGKRSKVLPRVRAWLRRSGGRMAPWGTRRRSVVMEPIRAFRMWRTEGTGPLLRHLSSPWTWLPRMWKPAFPTADWFDKLTGPDQYAFWLQRLVLSPKRLRAMRRQVRGFRLKPTISVVMPVHDPRPEWLEDAIESVRRQIYPHWQLCIADDGSQRGDIRQMLTRYEKDQRIRVTYLQDNRGIAAASNEALRLATGEFVGFLDHDDVLKPNALLEVVKMLNQEPHLDYLYSDEDKQELDGRLVAHFFKPDWSPDLLMSVNYVTHFSVYRRTLLAELDGLREGFDGSQDYDLVLRATELTDRIGHVPLPLYSWRKVPGSAATSLDFKDYAWEAGRKAVMEAARRRGWDADVVPAAAPYRYRVRYRIKGQPKVTIIIPTRDKVKLLKQCVDSIERLSSYPNSEMIVVDNQSSDPETLSYLSSFEGRVVRYPHPFNYSRMINFAVRDIGETDFLLFLNNDTEVISGEWIEALVEHGQRDEVGAVGARLLFRDGAPQHEGVVIGPSGGLPRNIEHRGTYHLGDTIRNCSAVTFACALTRPDVYWALGGLDESFQVAYQDVDFCLRAREKGYWIVYTPHALLYHDEGGTRGRRGRTHPEEDSRLFLERWGGYRDPFYNPNFDLDRLFELQPDLSLLPHLQ
jgi:GT2 family glycosyltransferase